MSKNLKVGTRVTISNPYITDSSNITGVVIDVIIDVEHSDENVSYHIKLDNPAISELDVHRNAAGELWLCDFEVAPTII